MRNQRIPLKSVHMKRAKNLLILCVILGMGHFWTLDSLDSFSDSQHQPDQIAGIRIIYRWGDYYTFYYQCYKIANKNGIYYTTTGKEIDSQLILSLADSLTDLYETDEYEETYEGRYIIDYEPHFEVRLRYASGKKIVMKSDSDYHCFIPWNVIYNGKLYVQYNGRIPSALVRILMALDDGWSFLKESRWECYSAVVPDRYLEKGVSEDFPESKPQVTPEEVLGKTHVLWKAHLDSAIISSPVYANGRVFVISIERVVSFDVKTGERIWDVGIWNGGVYVYADDGRLYCLDLETGNVIWFFETEEDFAAFSRDRRPIYASEIEDGFIFVATKRGNLFAFSLVDLRFPGQLLKT